MKNEWAIAVYNDREDSHKQNSQKETLYTKYYICEYIILHLYKVYNWENWNMVLEIRKPLLSERSQAVT